MSGVAPSPTQEHLGHGALEPPEGEFCDLCGERALEVMSKAAWDASGLYICNPCLEAMLDASADDTCSEMGLVGGRH